MYRCRERFHKENVHSKSCYVFAEASGRTEPSEHVLGMEELRFSKPVQAEQKVQGRTAHEPVEAISGSNTTNSAIEVGRTSEVYAVRFTCQHPDLFLVCPINIFCYFTNQAGHLFVLFHVLFWLSFQQHFSPATLFARHTF